MRQEAEQFEDGKQTIRTYDAEDRLCCIETVSPAGHLTVAIDYLYDEAGVNVERIVRNGGGTVLRRMYFDADGNELSANTKGTVRWASMDGSEAGVDPLGEEQVARDGTGEGAADTEIPDSQE